MLYLQAIGSSMGLSIFFVFIFVSIEKHVSSSFMVTNYSSQTASLRQASFDDLFVDLYLYHGIHEVPKRRWQRQWDSRVGQQHPTLLKPDNQWNGKWLITVTNLLSQGLLLQMFFSNFFQLVLSLSRLIDGLNTLDDSKLKYRSFQKKCFNTQMLCELIQPIRVVLPVE